LDVNDVLEHITDKATAPTDATLLGARNKGEAKEMSIILDGVKDHIIPHLLGKTSAKDMWEALGIASIIVKMKTRLWCFRKGCEVLRWLRAKV
jgi:hypothetical protein